MQRTTFIKKLSSLEHRYHVHHPFDKLLQSGRASKEMLQMWAANRYYYQDTIPRKDAAIISKCSISSVRSIWCKHIITHDVDNALQEWLMLTRALELDDKDVISRKYLLPGTIFACDAYFTFCKESSWQEGICSSMTHLFAQNIHQLRIDNWPRMYPWLPKEAFTYFMNRTRTLPSEIDASVDLLYEYFGKTEETMSRALEIMKFKQDVLWSMMDALWIYFFARECRLPKSMISAVGGPVLHVLGSAAGGGVPQWNRHDSLNDKARHHCSPQMMQSSVAISHDKKEWILVNCSPDFGLQWNNLVRKYPGSSLHSILLTDNQLDHVGGLLSLRQSDTPIHIYCRKNVCESLYTDTSLLQNLESYCKVQTHIIHNTVNINGLNMCVHVLSNRKSKYASNATDVIALVIHDKILYAPSVAEEALDSNFAKIAAGCQHVLLDGTFYTRDEMPSVSGHVCVKDTLAFFEDNKLPKPTFLHVNNTNDMCSKSDSQVAYDGMEFLF